METQEMTDIVSQKTNALANRDLASIVLSGAVLCQPAVTVATGRLSPELAENDRRRAEKAARRAAASRAKEAAARKRVEAARQKKEADELRRGRMIGEIGQD